MRSKALEEYLKTMYVLQKQNGNIRVTDIANKMNCSKPSVNKALNNLKEEKLVKYETYGTIELTEDGESLAQKILEAYDIVYLFLKDVLNLDEESAKKMFEQTGVDAIMIARGTMGNPWIFKQIQHYLETGEKLSKPSNQEKYEILKEHIEFDIAYKGEGVALNEMRKHISWYTKNMPDSSSFRNEINHITTKEELLQKIENYFL